MDERKRKGLLVRASKSMDILRMEKTIAGECHEFMQRNENFIFFEDFELGPYTCLGGLKVFQSPAMVDNGACSIAVYGKKVLKLVSERLAK